MGNSSKNNWFYIVFLVLITTFIGFIIVWTILNNLILSGEHVILIMLISLIGLSFSFDKLMIGKMFSIEKQIESVKEQQSELTEDNIKIQKENLQFKHDMITVMLNSLNQISNQSNMTKQSVTVANVLPSNSKEDNESGEEEDSIHNVKEFEGDSEYKPNPTSTEGGVEQSAILKGSSIPVGGIPSTYKDLRKYTEIDAINNIANSMGFTLKDISYQVKISFSDSLSSGRNKTVDAFIDSGGIHFFFEVVYGSFRVEKLERIYNMLNDIKLYSEVNKIPAQLILILVNNPNDNFNRYENLEEEKEKYIKRLRPAFDNKFISIHSIEYDYEEFKKNLVEASATKE